LFSRLYLKRGFTDNGRNEDGLSAIGKLALGEWIMITNKRWIAVILLEHRLIQMSALIKPIITKLLSNIRSAKHYVATQNRSLFLTLMNGFIDLVFVKDEVYLSLSKLKESNEMKVFRKIANVKGDLFLDIGAYHGSYALRLSKNFTKVVAFEPNKHNFTVLSILVKLLRKTNITPMNIAVSQQDGITKLFISDSDFEHTLKSNCANNPNRFTVVKVICLNSFIKHPIDLIKVDVQGVAIDVLLGANLVMKNVKRWVIELEQQELERKGELEKLLKSFGYNIEWLSNQHIYAYN